jgi:colanic acid biosynthesis protein WcaH
MAGILVVTDSRFYRIFASDHSDFNMETTPKKLPLDAFMHVVKHAPLVSIDLLVYNDSNQILLGWRKNQPAKDFWFVPGGRIHKDETIPAAFARITLSETGMPCEIAHAVFHGVYEHHYPGDNFAAQPDFGTHYIVLAFEIKLTHTDIPLPREQHVEYCWMPIRELLESPKVHMNVKNYFNGWETF